VLVIDEYLAAGLAFGHPLWFGTERNVERPVAHVRTSSGSTST
jgi:hypothetical protein